MLPKHHRLSRQDVQNLFKTGTRKSFPGFTVIYSPVSSAGPKLAVIVPQSISKLSTGRNLIRRKYYSALSNSTHPLPSITAALLVKNSSFLPTVDIITSALKKVSDSISLTRPDDTSIS